MVTSGGMMNSPSHTTKPLKLEVNDVAISYRGQTILNDVNIHVHENEIFGIIGPANSGKTSCLKALNRMDIFNPAMKVDGQIRFSGKDIRKWRNVYSLRSRIGVVFPTPRGWPNQPRGPPDHRDRYGCRSGRLEIRRLRQYCCLG